MSYAFATPKESQQNINFKKKWLASHQEVIATQSLDQIVESIKTLENNSIFSNEMIVVYKTQDFTPLYVSKNIEKILGYTQDEFLSWKEGAFFKIGAINQPEFYTNLLKWELQFKNSNPQSASIKRGRGHYCGITYLHKDETTRQFLVRHEMALSADFEIPDFDLLYFVDINHLVKGEDYWILFESFNESQNFSKLFRKEGVDKYPITVREKEVLMLISNGKSTKEVATELKISPDTVGQHRKNMIKKMMAKDTSSLIHLCKICEII